MPELQLADLPQMALHFPDACPALSRPLIDALISRISINSGTVLSIGCGSGLLESFLLKATQNRLDLYGIEIPSCVNKHLPQDRYLTVPSTSSVHSDAVLATTLLFVYPRSSTLVAKYLDACLDGALYEVIWLSHRDDWPEYEKLLLCAFFSIELIEQPGIAAYELMVFASMPRPPRQSPR